MITDRCIQNLSFYGEPGLSKTIGQPMRLAAQALDRKPQFTAQVAEIHAAQIPHFHVLQVLPDPFPGVEVRGIGRELLHVDLSGCPVGQRGDVPPSWGGKVSGRAAEAGPQSGYEYFHQALGNGLHRRGDGGTSWPCSFSIGVSTAW
jgi:hypothetical protein